MLASILMAQQQQGGARAHSRQAWLLCLAPVNGSVAAWLAPPLWLGVTPVRAHTGRSHSAEERVPRCRADRPGLGLSLTTPRGLWTATVASTAHVSLWWGPNAAYHARPGVSRTASC